MSTQQLSTFECTHSTPQHSPMGFCCVLASWYRVRAVRMSNDTAQLGTTLLFIFTDVCRVLRGPPMIDRMGVPRDKVGHHDHVGYRANHSFFRCCAKPERHQDDTAGKAPVKHKRSAKFVPLIRKPARCALQSSTKSTLHRKASHHSNTRKHSSSHTPL